MSVEKLIASYLRIASDDLREARILFEAKGRNSVYLAEQAAEQLIFAIAQSEEIHFGRDLNHQLDRMLVRLPDDNPFKAALQSVSWLEAYATTYKYRGLRVRSPVGLKARSSRALLTSLRGSTGS